jgi:hypothetical protein
MEEIASGFAGGREPGKAEEAFRALVEGGQGFLGLEPGRKGSEAYRTGQALSNLPALALPAAAIKGTGKAKDALKALGKKETLAVDFARVFEEVDKLPTNQYIDDIRSAHIGGVGNFGEGDAKYFFSRVPGGEQYIKQSQQIAKKNLGNQFMGYRLMSRDEFEALQAGDVGDLLSFSLDRNAAEAFRNFVKNQNRKDLVVAQVPLTPKHVVAFGSPGEKEIIVDTAQGWAMDAFKLADPITKAPEIKKSGKLTQVEKELLERGGERQAKRLQRAADEIPGLEDQYQSNALIRAFLGRKGYPYQGVMTMKSGDFENFARPLNLPLGQYSKENIENLRNVLAQGGSFDDVPFLMMDRKDNIPFITGHEGRHRTRALQASGQPKTLVEVYPHSGLEMGADYRRMKATEWLEKFNEALGEGRLVLPENLDPDVYFDDIFKKRLPDVYAHGGEVSTTDFIRKRQAGSPPEGEMSNDEYIQQMFTGTLPAEDRRNPNVLRDLVRGVTYTPFDLLGGAVDISALLMQPFGYNVEKPVGGSDWFIEQAAKRGLVQPSTGSGAELLGRIVGGIATPGAARGVGRAASKAEEVISREMQAAPVGAITVPGAKAQVTPPKNEMGFFSPTEQVVMNLPQEKGTAQQMLAQISKAPGAKAAELRATGLEEFLKSKGTAPVTRQEIQDYLANNRVQVNEVVLGRGPKLSPEAKRLSDEALSRMESIDDKLAKYFEGVEEVAGQDPYFVFIRLRGPLGRKAAEGDQDALNELNALNLPSEVKNLVLEFGRNKNEYTKYTSQARKMEKPRFDIYNIPGGTNAREIYLTLPLKKSTEAEARSVVGDETWSRMTPEQRQEFMSYPTDAAKQNQFTVPSAHSVSPEADKNRLAHIFLDDRTDAEGKKVLFVQEMQSDWAQQGRDKGFGPKTETLVEAYYETEAGQRIPIGFGKTKEEADASIDVGWKDLVDIKYETIERKVAEGVPPAPFVSTQQYQVMKDGKPLVTKNKKGQDVPHVYSSPEDAQRAAERFGGTVKDIGMQENTEGWVNLALKRVINEAVDNGYDKVAFINGSQAAKKYSLSTVLDGIEVGPSQLQSFTFLSPNSPRLVELKQKGGGIIPLFVNQKGVVETVDDDSYRQQFIDKPLSEIVGKEMSEKIMTATLKPGGESSVNFTVKDMEVGGEGMKGFYDNILPKTANKLLAKLGSKIEPVEVVKEDPSQMPFEANAFLDWMFFRHPGISRSDAARAWGMGIDNNMFVREFYEAEATKADQHLGFKITPEMIDMVKTQGLPQFAAGGEVTKFIKERSRGSPPEGEMTNDEYIQQMFTGTPPMDRQRNLGILPPEIRGAVDVPLDILNLLVRGGAGAVAGPAYGVYKGLTSDKFGTPEGVQEASSEAGRMMQKITGTPKTQTARDTLEFIGKKAEEYKLAPTPQLLTLPAPGPGAASALLRNYELAQTPPVGAIKVPGKETRTFSDIPSDKSPFVGRLDKMVAELPGPVQKEQFLNQLKGKFRDYEIGRAREALKDLPDNAKITPFDLLNKIKEDFDPSRYGTSITRPDANKPDQFFASMDNVYKAPLGVIHLRQLANPMVEANLGRARDMYQALKSKTHSGINSDLSAPDVFNNYKANINEFLRDLNQPERAVEANRLLDYAQSSINLYERLTDAVDSINYPILSSVYKTLQAEQKALSKPFDMGATIRIAIQSGVDELDNLFPGIKVNLNDDIQALLSLDPALRKQASSNIQNAFAPHENAARESFRQSMTGLRDTLERAYTSPTSPAAQFEYKGQHPTSLGGVPNEIAFSRFSEHKTTLPDLGKVEGIYVHELQSDRLDDIRKRGALGGSPTKDVQKASELGKQLQELVEQTAAERQRYLDNPTQEQKERTIEIGKQRDRVQGQMNKFIKRIGEGDYKIKESFVGMEESPQVIQQLMAKNVIAAAIQMGKNFVAFPGAESSQAQLYEKLPNNLKQVVKDLGPGFEYRSITLTTPDGQDIMHPAVVWDRYGAGKISTEGIPFKKGGEIRTEDFIKKVLR